MLTNLFISLGWSRDDLKWFWLQVVAVAGLISSNVFDVPYWMAYLHIPLSPTALHWIFATSALVLWLAGKYNSSPLPSAGAMASGTVPNSPTGPKIAAVLLACALAAGTMTGCVGKLTPAAPPNLTPQVTAKFYATYAIKDLDVIRDFAYDASKTTPPLVDAKTLLVIVDWHESLVNIIHAAPDGWRAAVLAGLTEIEGKLSATNKAKFGAAIAAARAYAEAS